ncbi:hypothetical protein N825_33470 [Skermanella stibiiresistens SB22]|uniref:Helix-turn-helix domain-containing protein n=1 Tax=Skermanella stibiiresistens SB22 TaxID=1385369 RepID=W9H823_9PROT|nr:hypothetical protein N825_33470 [Skermanella stibiiresistens SB22]
MRAEWLFHPDVGVDEFALLACLATYQDKRGFCWPSQTTLATRLKRSRPWIIKVLNRLVELGLIERTRRVRDDGGLRSCLYRIVPEAEKALEQAGPEGDRGCPTGDTNQDHPIQETLSLPRGSAADEPEHSIDAPRRIAKQVPIDWRPSEEDLAWAAETHPAIDAAALTEAFVTGCGAKGYRYIDVGCAWRGWFANQQRWKQERENGSHDRQARRPNERAGTGSVRSDRDAVSGQRTGNARAGHQRAGGERRQGDPGLAERNASAADACLERLMARRARHSPAGAGP